MPRKNPKDRKDLRNYTEVDEEEFDRIWKEFGNKDEKLKIIDDGKRPELVYLVWTKFFGKE